MTFPIDPLLPQLRAVFAQQTRLVLEAPPGAGKTTRVAPALLDEAWLHGRKILLLEPRRIAARAAAEFMAAQRGERVGETVGYRIRFESRVSAATRIEVVTEGILTRLIQDDPELAGIGAILFDEFHERHLHGDLGAALALDVQANLRPDLRLAIMSATLDGDRIARWFDASSLVSEGRSFPVRIAHPPVRADETWPERGWPFHLRRAVEQALAENDGDVLVFLPGRREIDRAREVLGTLASAPGADGNAALARTIDIVALHGELSVAEQHAALASAPAGRRRIVLATNVAESSLTLPGVRAVVDTGLAREPRFDPSSGFTRLETVHVSQASAVQRSGRAGRLGAGTCYRLWPQSRRLEAARRPEIGQVELSQLALELSAWGSDALPWLDAPPPGALAQARDLLRNLGALDVDLRITARGRAMLALAASPRLAAAILRAHDGERRLACELVALIDARNPLRGEAARSDDFRARASALRTWRENGAAAARAIGADAQALAAIAQAADAWQRRARGDGNARGGAPVRGHSARVAAGEPAATRGAMQTRGIDQSSNAAAHAVRDETAAGDLLIHAFPDRIARQDAANPRRYQLANGRGARLRDDSALYGEPWLVIVELRHEARDSLIFSAAPFDGTRLQREFPARFRRERRVHWNADARAVEAFEEERFDAIVLESRNVPARAEDALPALLAGVRELGLDVLPWSDAARDLRTRVQSLREWAPEHAFPDFSDGALLATLEHWLAPALAGKRRLESLAANELSDALAAQLDYALRRTLDEQAPASVRVPSGLDRPIAYTAGAAPVLAVKLQELFGLADTPRIAGGRVPLTLHLLSPGGRPIQVTQDLRSFWERTYPEVRKELKGRYPKHPWPDDPWTATPTHRAKPRR